LHQLRHTPHETCSCEEERNKHKMSNECEAPTSALQVFQLWMMSQLRGHLARLSCPASSSEPTSCATACTMNRMNTSKLRQVPLPQDKHATSVQARYSYSAIRCIFSPSRSNRSTCVRCFLNSVSPSSYTWRFISLHLLVLHVTGLPHPPCDHYEVQPQLLDT
jgi:hypothetical protein